MFKFIKFKHRIRSRRPLFIALGFLLLIGPSIYLYSKFANPAKADWFNDSWSYRKAITIPSHTSPESSVYVTVPTFDATDTTKFQSDCGDLRFTKQNGELLQYYVVDCDATANIHVFFDSLAAGATNYYMYYGNVAAANGFSSADFSNAATGLGTQTLASEERSESPIAYWKFDEGTGTTAQDSTSNNIDGTITGATWQAEDKCISGKCLSFDGTGDNISNTSLANTSFPVNGTLSFWVNPSTMTTDGTSIFDIFDAARKHLFIRFCSSGNGGCGGASSGARQLQVAFQDTIGYKYSRLISIKENSWTHVTVVWDTTNDLGKLYINGNLDNSSSITDSSWTPDGQTVQFMNSSIGKLDDVKIFPYARTSAQIKSDYRARGSSKGTSVSLSQNSQNDDALSNGLVGYWKMEDTATPSIDSSGNGNSMTWGGNTVSSSGKFGNATSFDGTGDYVTSATNLDYSSNAITAAAWIYPTESSAVRQSIISSKENSTAGFVMHLGEGGTNTLGLYVYNGAWRHVVGTTQIPINTWTFVSATYDGNDLKVYVNGRLENTANFPGTIVNTSASTSIGAKNSTNINEFQGKIDEVRIYNRSLSGGEVAKLYSFAPGPVAYYNFDEGTGSTANDHSGNNFAGTLVNSPTWNPGKFGKAITTNGSNSYINLTSGLSLLQTLNQGTVEMWFKTSADGVLFSIAKHDNSSGFMYLLVGDAGVTYNDESMCYGFRDVTVATNRLVACYRNGTSFLKDNKWHHVAFAVSDSGNRMLIDGKEVPLTYTTGTSATTNYFLNDAGFTMIALGTLPINNSFLYNLAATMDEVKVYNYARTQTQILEDMNGGHTTIGAKTPLAYYKFDEGHGTVANNAGFGGNGLNATISNANWTNSGKFSKALSFDGTSSYVQLGSTNLDTYFDATKNWSISTWVNITGWANEGAIFSNRYADTEFVRLYTTGTTGQLGLGTRDSGNTTINLTVSGLAANTWYQVMINRTYNGTIDLYINGALKASAADTRTGDFISEAGSHEYFVGRTVNNGDWVTWKYFTGLIDEVKIYNTALTAEEVKQDYNRNSLISFGGGSDTSALSGGSVASSSASAAYCVPGSSDPCSAPVAEWGFDEGQGTTTDDISGNGNTGTLTNGPTWTRGKIGKALSFDGTSNRVAGTISTSIFTDKVSVGTWVYRTDTGTDPGNPVFVDIGSAGGANGFRLYHDWVAGVFHYKWIIKESGAWATCFVTVVDNETTERNKWVYMEGTYNGSIAILYKNGVEIGRDTCTGGNIQFSGSNFYLGSINTSYYYAGKLDQVRIYNYARTPAQIAWDYNGGAPVAHYKLNECQGTVANDASGNGNHGTITIGATGSNTAIGTCTSSGAWADGVTGKFGGSLDFDGTDDNIPLPNLQLGGSGKNQVSISSWVNTTSTNSQTIFNFGVYTVKLLLNATNRIPSCFIRNSASTLVSVSGKAINSGVWNHLVCTYDGTNIKIYQDGKYIDIAALSGDIRNSEGAVPGTGYSIGTGVSYPALAYFEYFTGLLDDVRIYNYALTQAQIKDIYNENSAIRFGL